MNLKEDGKNGAMFEEREHPISTPHYAFGEYGEIRSIQF